MMKIILLPPTVHHVVVRGEITNTSHARDKSVCTIAIVICAIELTWFNQNNLKNNYDSN